MTSEVAPAASGRLSVADQLSGKGPRLIHHPLAVDCRTSLTTGLRTRLNAQVPPANRYDASAGLGSGPGPETGPGTRLPDMAGEPVRAIEDGAALIPELLMPMNYCYLDNTGRQSCCPVR